MQTILSRDLQVFQLWGGYFAIYLGQRFKSAHGKHGVAECDDDRHNRDCRPYGSVKPPETFLGELQVFRRRSRRNLRRALGNQGNGTPHQKHDNHYGHYLHDAQGFGAGFGNSLDVQPPEVKRHGDCEEDCKRIRRNLYPKSCGCGRFVDQMPQILAGADAADRAGENIVKQQRGNGKPCHKRTHGVPDHDIHAAPHEHAAAFHIHGPDGEAEEHDSQDEPRGTPPDRLLGNAADVVYARTEIVEHDGRSAPEGYEGEHDGAGNNHRCCSRAIGSRHKLSSLARDSCEPAEKHMPCNLKNSWRWDKETVNSL